MSVVGERIRMLREERGWSQLVLADTIGIHNSVLSRIESGKRDVENHLLNKLADVFGVSTDYLLGRTDERSGRRDEQEKTVEQLLQEKIADPDDYFFLDGYLEASDEEKKEIRRFWYELKKQMRENGVRPSKPMSLREFSENYSKPE